MQLLVPLVCLVAPVCVALGAALFGRPFSQAVSQVGVAALSLQVGAGPVLRVNDAARVLSV